MLILVLKLFIKYLVNVFYLNIKNQKIYIEIRKKKKNKKEIVLKCGLKIDLKWKFVIGWNL